MKLDSPFQPDQVKIAVIGGGTGSFTLLSALKDHSTQIAALVNMADDGGSTGVLRDELGVLPPGDIRQCLVALSDIPELRDLFNYRFDEGSLKGHAFGNLFLTALEKMKGDFSKGIELASELLNITGVVEPITTTNVTLVMKDDKGEVTKGQHNISLKDFSASRPELWLEPKTKPNPRAVAAIEEADMVIVAPGNLYGSLAPTLIAPGVGEALRRSDAFKIYVCNLVTKPGQTDSFQVSDFADEVERLAGGSFLDAVLYNTAKPSDELLKKYARDGELSVQYDENELKRAPYVAAGANILAGSIWKNTNKSDPIASERTLIRHDSAAVASALMELYDFHASNQTS